MPRPPAALLLGAAVTAAAGADTLPTIIHIIADDLGFNDLGYANGGKTHTPNIDAAVAAGISLTHYHTYKVCSPSRASIMTGRYPWGVGYYDMKGPEAVPLEYQMLPAALKRQRAYEAHAIGKWNLGAVARDYTPTFRGFDGFLGYYNAALRDYWYHGGNGPGCKPNSSDPVQYYTDLSNSTGAGVAAGVLPAPAALNGTYNEDFFTAEAVRLIGAHAARQRGAAAAAQTGLYVYLAYQNVHSAAQNKDSLSGSHPLHAPCDVVDGLYARTALDTYKVMGGMLTMLDYGVGNLTAALAAAGRPYVVAFAADNGGPLPHSTNAPLRGGKHTLWDGGVRVRAFVSGTAVPEARRGAVWDGLAHSSDWYLTLIEGVAGAALAPADVNATGPRPPDSRNLWPALLSGGDSPRTEVVHQVQNDYTRASGLKDAPTIRSGKYKLILGDPGEDSIAAWPAPGDAVPFGATDGSRDGYAEEQAAGSGNCRAAMLPSGVLPPPSGPDCSGGCLFDLSTDEAEAVNLFNDSSLQAVVQQLTQRLADVAATGPPWAFPLPNGPQLKALEQEICEYQARTGYFEPVRDSLPPAPPATPAPPPSPPAPPPAPCSATLKQSCPLSRFNDPKDCLACTRKMPANNCKPKQRQAYCNGTAVAAAAAGR